MAWHAHIKNKLLVLNFFITKSSCSDAHYLLFHSLEHFFDTAEQLDFFLHCYMGSTMSSKGAEAGNTEDAEYFYQRLFSPSTKQGPALKERWIRKESEGFVKRAMDSPS